MKLSKDSKILIAIFAIQAVVELFLNTFLSAYLFQLSKNGIVSVSWLNIYTYSILIFGFILTGRWMMKGRELFMYRLSFFVDALLFLCIIYFKENSVNMVWVLGLIWGIERVAFYFPQNLITSVVVKNEQLIKFTGYRGSLCGLARIVMPVILGGSIEFNSFISTAVFVLGLIILKLILSFLITYIPKEKTDFSLSQIPPMLFNTKRVKYSLGIEFIRGFVSVTLDTLIVLYVVYIFHTNLKLGIFASIFSLCMVISNGILGKYLKYSFFKPLLLICGLILFSASAYFVFAPDKFSFIVYNFAFAIGGSLIRTMANINFFRLSQDKEEVNTHRAEYIALRECIINIGRVVGSFIIIWVAKSNHPENLKYLIMLFSLFYGILAYMSAQLAQKLSNAK